MSYFLLLICSATIPVIKHSPPPPLFAQVEKKDDEDYLADIRGLLADWRKGGYWPVPWPKGK